MPNWCSNYVTISGSKKEIKKIADILDANSEGNLFESLVGIDPNISREEYDNGGWYNSNCDFWGCKWDVPIELAHINIEEEEIRLSFDTAWSPPFNFYIELSKRFNTSLNAIYDEPGLDFAGEVDIDEDGNVHNREYKYLEGIYHRGDEYFWDEVGRQLDYMLEEGEDVTAKYIAEWLPFMTDADLYDLLQEYEDKLQLTN